MAKEKTSVAHKIFTVIGILLCIVLTPVLVVNCTLIVKGWINKGEVPSIGGIAPMIVLTDSMEGDKEDNFSGGDLIFVQTVTAEEIKVGDIISFFDPAASGGSVTSHRVIEIITEEGEISFKTKGDNNNTEDKLPIPANMLVGKYTGFKLEKAGSIAMFMQTTRGLIICVVVPLVLLVGYDAIRRASYNKKHASDKDELLAELEELRKLKAEKEALGEAETTENKE